MEIRLDRKVALVAVSLCLMGQTGWAEEGTGAGALPEPRWIPSIELGFDLFKYETTSTVVEVATDPRPADALNPNFNGQQANSITEIAFRLGGELMGPSFDSIPGGPRLFVQGGVHLQSFATERVFTIGDIGSPETAVGGINRHLGSLERSLARGCQHVPVGEMRPDDVVSCPNLEPDEIPEQGSRIDAKFESPSWFAAIGVAFHVPLSENLLLQIKPSVAYTGESIDLTGKLTTVNEPMLDRFEVLRDVTDKSITDHSLGVGLELGLVLFRDVRPVRTTLFANTRFMWLLTDRTTTFGVTNGLATYTVRRDNMMVRGGAGVRFSWVGFGGD